MNLLVQLVLSFVGATTAAVLFTVPRRSLLWCGALGSIAWFTALGLTQKGLAPAAADFVAAFVVAVGAEACARLQQTPVPCFAAPGVIPLVPGISAYRAMYALVNGQYPQGQSLAFQTFMMAAAIAAGLVLAGSIYHAVRRSKTDLKVEGSGTVAGG